MEKTKKIKKDNGIVRISVSKDLCEVLDRIKESVLEHGWEAKSLRKRLGGYVVSSEILAKKVTDANLV